MALDGPNAFLKAMQKLSMVLGGPNGASKCSACLSTNNSKMAHYSLKIKCYVNCTELAQVDHYRWLQML